VNNPVVVNVSRDGTGRALGRGWEPGPAELAEAAAAVQLVALVRQELRSRPAGATLQARTFYFPVNLTHLHDPSHSICRRMPDQQTACLPDMSECYKSNRGLDNSPLRSSHMRWLVTHGRHMTTLSSAASGIGF